ncbi:MULTISPECIES: di-heme-cytochrome C peroxidase [unclassified Bradyrhizobium]|uniref:di-heme-cytochrome C peroxidase n=1 Tax=unclassified Bradyrhizobium TaxID=2631580 RepID=UPI0028E36261|nr:MULTISPECIES: di-heme-cytochrome C peroxidase [unclassified Bradyrhizobium]
MQEDSARARDALPGQLPVSSDNPCPFLRALVAGGFVDGHSVPLKTIGDRVEAASGETGFKKRLVGIETFGVALIANGLSPLRLLKSLWSGADLDQLRNGPLDKHGGGSRILDAEAKVHPEEIDRFASFGSDYPDPNGGTERGLNEAQIQTFMKANLTRDGDRARWYFPILMQGEWPVLLNILGKGEGDGRYLSVAEVRTLFVDRRLPQRIAARLMAKPKPANIVWRIGKALVGTAVLAGAAVLLAWVAAPDAVSDKLGKVLPKKVAALIPPALPETEPTRAAYWLDQGWTTQDRHWFHHVTQGTATFPIPYAWFMAMEQPYLAPFGTPGLISDSAYLERFGFIPSPKSVDGDPSVLRPFGYAATAAKTEPAAPLPAGLKPTPAGNEGGLPVGFARLTGATDPATGAAQSDKIGLTCAACHSGSIHYKGVSVRFDGGPGMVDLRKLEEAMGFAMIFTQYVPGRFTRFADRVLGPNASDADRASLKKGLKAAIDFALNMQANNYKTTIEAKGQTETEEGFGRLDALNRIGNQVFYLDMASSGLPNMLDNQEAIDAPVSYPPIWTVPWFSWAQYDGSIAQPLIRNAGEALGVSAQINFSPKTASDRLWRSSMAIDNLLYIENMLRGPDPFATTTPAFGGLTSPKWPEKLFAGDDAWKIDPARVERGRKLYAAVCVECHLGPVADTVFDKTYPDKSFWKIKPADDWESKGWNAKGPILDLVQKPVEAMQTDPGQASILANRKVNVAGFLEVDPAKDLKGCNLPQGSTTEMPYALALMAVVQKASDKWMEDRKISEAERTALWGDRRNCPNPAGKSYRARPLNGVWATAPYLHNGSVPSLYWLLTPAAERPTSFCQGARDYDPKSVGFAVPKGGESTCKVGQTLFVTSDSSGKPIKGNSTLGHSFEGPTKPNKDYPNGIIGGAFSEDERWDLIEYLKTL